MHVFISIFIFTFIFIFIYLFIYLSIYLFKYINIHIMCAYTVFTTALILQFIPINPTTALRSRSLFPHDSSVTLDLVARPDLSMPSMAAMCIATLRSSGSNAHRRVKSRISISDSLAAAAIIHIHIHIHIYIYIHVYIYNIHRIHHSSQQNCAIQAFTPPSRRNRLSRFHLSCSSLRDPT